MLPASAIKASLQTAGQTKNKGDTILGTIISRGTIINVFTFDEMMHLRSEHGKKSCSKDLNHQTLAREVNLVVIHISLFRTA